MTANELLRHQTQLAFDRDTEMSMKASLRDVTEEMANWKDGGALTKSIAEIVWHVAWAKLWYCQQAFGLDTEVDEPSAYAAKLERLDEAQARLLECLEGRTEQQLAEPVDTQFHNESAAHLFSILAIHDVSHGASIRAIKRLFSGRVA